MKYEIVELKEMKVVGVVKRTTNENMQSAKDIAVMWKEFFEKGLYNSIENKKNNKVLGIYTNYESDFTKPYDFITACEVENIKEDNFYSLIIPKGKYAKFSIENKNLVISVWQYVWKSDLNRKYECDFEIYHNMFNENEQNIDIYISIK